MMHHWWTDNVCGMVFILYHVVDDCKMHIWSLILSNVQLGVVKRRHFKKDSKNLRYLIYFEIVWVCSGNHFIVEVSKSLKFDFKNSAESCICFKHRQLSQVSCLALIHMRALHYTAYITQNALFTLQLPTGIEYIVPHVKSALESLGCLSIS